VRTFLAISLQLARTFPRLVDLISGVYEGDRTRVRRAACALAEAILDGARDRGVGPLVRSLIDQQRRSEPLRHTRPRRPGRSSQALVSRARRAKARR
jgi:hypothetical protein